MKRDKILGLIDREEYSDLITICGGGFDLDLGGDLGTVPLRAEIAYGRDWGSVAGGRHHYLLARLALADGAPDHDVPKPGAVEWKFCIRSDKGICKTGKTRRLPVSSELKR